MSKLLKYAEKSSLMDITIKLADQVFNFNLFKEVQINEDGIDNELISQPSVYAFITVLHKQLIQKLGNGRIDEKKSYAKAYIKYKSEINPETHRPNSDDLAKQKAELDRDYLIHQRKNIATLKDLQIIESCVKSLEQRKDMLQTLSANIRREKQ